MSTAGVYGFIKNGVEKIGYSNCDSYPDWLGVKIVKFINETTKEEMEQIFEKIILVDESMIATEEQIKKCEKWFASLTHGEKSNWYDLIRLTQGNLDLYKDEELEYMFSGKDMYADYKYIINLDNNELEIYETDFDTKEEKVIGIYLLDKVTERDMELLSNESLEKNEIKDSVGIEELNSMERKKVLLEKIVELCKEEEVRRYFVSQYIDTVIA